MEDTYGTTKSVGREVHTTLFKKKRGRKPTIKELIVPPLPSEAHQESAKEITPWFEICEPIVRSRGMQHLRAGYYRYNQPAFPPRKYIELTQNDYQFIESEQGKYKYYDFYLLSPDRLIKAYIFFSSIQSNEQSGQQYIEKLKQQLLDCNQELSYAIFQLLKTQSPSLFQSFAEILFKRWQYRFNETDYFRPNTPDHLSKDTQTYITKKPSVSSRSIKYLKQTKHTLVTTALQLVDKHMQMRASHQVKKQELVRFLLGFFRDINLINSDIVFEPINIEENEVTLIDLDKKLRNLIEELNKWKQSQQGSEKTSVYSKSSGSVIPNISMKADNISQISNS